MDSLGDRLRTARESAHHRFDREHRITQTELGNIIGYSQSAIYQIEQNKRKRREIDAQKLIAAAKFLRVSFMWLATGIGDMEQDDNEQLESIELSEHSFPVIAPNDIRRKNRYPEFYMNLPASIYDAVSENAFFTTVGDNGIAPEAFTGDLALVDPEGAIQIGSYVMATINGKSLPVIRIIIEGDDEYLLKPLNDEFSVRPLGAIENLIGIVVEIRSCKIKGLTYLKRATHSIPLSLPKLSGIAG